MKRLKPFIIGAAGGIFGLVLLPLSGMLPISAVPGPPAIIDWYLNMAAQQSIALRSLEIAVPELDDREKIQRGAGHYEMVCADCHGSPTHPASTLADTLSPPPPLLTERMQQWHPSQRLFFTVKHGIRRTAMPGWPSQMREDEVWDMVAFIEALPQITREDYAALTPGDARNDCARCHGDNGEGRLPGVPRLDIQSPAYLEMALKSFRDGTRQSGTMIAASRGLTNTEISELAAHFGRSRDLPAGNETTGAAIARSGIPDRDIPACASCHNSQARAEYPRLAGQDIDYLRTQLELFTEYGAERGGPNAHIMAEIARELSQHDIEALAAYFGR